MNAGALLVQQDDGDPRVFTGPFSIGTGEECELRIADQYASSLHARCAPQGGDWVIEDQGSVNGTRVNGVPAWGPWPLRKGDLVRIGRTTLTMVPS